jgi:sarcosine/dimethylglycine N-methyltransferase
MAESDVVNVTKDYYDSSDANNFYFKVWGGEDIHVGLYKSDSEPIFDASQRTVEAMLEKLPTLDKSTKVLDVGAGFGGSARYMAKRFGCPVECLNLSKAQNDVNRKLNKEQGLDQLIGVTEGNFEELPYADASFDYVWCQDSILHSGKREKVLEEVYRVMKPGGVFIFTDPMQDESSKKEQLQPVLNRIHLESLANPTFYQEAAKKIGFKDVSYEDHSNQLTNHYGRVLKELSGREKDLEGDISQDYIDRMKAGLQHWVDAGNKGLLRWGIFRFTK